MQRNVTDVRSYIARDWSLRRNALERGDAVPRGMARGLPLSPCVPAGVARPRDLTKGMLQSPASPSSGELDQ